MKHFHVSSSIFKLIKVGTDVYNFYQNLKYYFMTKTHYMFLF